MKQSVRLFNNTLEMASCLAQDIVKRITHAAGSEQLYSIAFSGGSTPILLYSILGDEYSDAIPWEFVHFFWGDERCVPPESTESNFGMVKKHIIDRINIPEDNIHRIRGEEKPEEEAARYSGILRNTLRHRDGIPVIDLQIMGIGEDGHTASIFPGDMSLFSTTALCSVTMHPVSKQKRITLTGSVINNSEAIVLLAEGWKKAGIIGSILNKTGSFMNFPAALVSPVYGSLDWYLEKEAAGKVDPLNITNLPVVS